MRKSWERLKEIWADLLLIGYGGFTTWVFVHIVIYGSMWVTEQTLWVLWIEVALGPLVVCLSIERLVKDVRRKGKS